MAKDNLGLVKYAEKALKENWGYVWGTFGQVLNETLLQQKIKQYPQGVGNYRTFIRENYMGRRTADCVGLIKSYMWYDERSKQIRYTPSTDVNADGMYARAKVKGPLSTMPERVGLCVWRKGHIGVYIGNGWVIEAQGTKYGVRKNRLRDRTFTHWLECPYIEYVKLEVPSKPKEDDKVEKTKIKVSIHGKPKVLEGFLKDQTNYVPIRLLEELGYKVSWEQTTKTVKVEYKE